MENASTRSRRVTNKKAFDEREYALEMARFVDAQAASCVPVAGRLLERFRANRLASGHAVRRAQLLCAVAVMRAAKEGGVKVLIDGQGGDEVFGGYAKFRYAYLASLLRARQIRHRHAGVDRHAASG